MELKLIAEYINYLEVDRALSFNSLRLYKGDLMDFEKFIIANHGMHFDLTKLHSESLNKFIHSIEAQGRSTATVNRKLTAVHGFWVWMRDQSWVSRDPFTQIQRDSQFRNKVPKSLSEEEIVMLLDCPEHDLKTRMVLELIYATGIRVGEITKLTITDIDIESQLITIPRSIKFKERVIPFNQLLAGYIKEYIADHQLPADSKLLLNKFREPVSEREVFRLIREAAHNVGIKKHVSPSILRNSFLKHMKENGAHDTLLRDITGQKTVL